MFIQLNKRGQSTLEYAVLISVVIASLVYMQRYIKRGVQGRLKAGADGIGEQWSPGQSHGHTIINSKEDISEVTTNGVTTITTTKKAGDGAGGKENTTHEEDHLGILATEPLYD